MPNGDRGNPDWFEWLRRQIPYPGWTPDWIGGVEGRKPEVSEWTYGAFREQLREVLNDLINIGQIDEAMRDTLLGQIDRVIAAEVPAGKLDRLIPATSKLMEWQEASGLGFNLVTDPDPTVLKTFLDRQKAGLKGRETEAREEYLETAFLKSLEAMSPATKAKRYELAGEGYREVETPRERAIREQRETQGRTQKYLGFLGQARGIPEPGRSWSQQQKAGAMGKYWGWVGKEFPEAETITYPFLEGLTGSSAFQQFARGKVGEFAQRYAKPRREWWGGMHQLPIETRTGARGFPGFFEWQRRERGRDPLKMAIEKYPFYEEFMKKPPRERGFYPGRIAPPARWY